MKKSMQPLFQIIFSRVFCAAIVMVMIGLSIVSIILSQYVLKQFGKNRLDVLSQIASQNQVVKNVSASVTDSLTENLGRAISEEGSFESAVQVEMAAAQKIFDEYGMDTTIDIVKTETKDRYSTSSINKKEPTQQLISSYWYINLATQKVDRTWNLRLLDQDDAYSSVLAYGRTLCDENGQVVCVIIANTAQRMLYDSYQTLDRMDSQIYIVDESGTIISHTNAGLIGFSLYYMGAQKDNLQKNSTGIEKKRNGYYLVSQYFDAATQWTVIEEMKVDLILLSYQDIFLQVSGIVLFFMLLAILLSYMTSLKISRPLMALEKRMSRVHQDNLEEMTEQNAYLEVYWLSRTFNSMIVRIRELIEDIKTQEKRRNATEFNFLQAQINPHFLHNTLIGIKALILTGRNDRAQQMISALIAILKNPIHASHELQPLRCEMEYVRQYVVLMECRYGRDFHLTCRIEQDLEDFLIPPMIVQPLVENAIFHGLSMLEEEALLEIDVFRTQGEIVLQVSDNGEGMTEQQLRSIWTPTDQRKGFNRISMNNIRSRIQYVYGAGAEIKVESALHRGTKVQIVMTLDREGKYHEAADRG